MSTGMMLPWVYGGSSLSQERKAGAHRHPQDLSIGVCSWKQQNDSEEEMKIGKGTSVSGLLLKMVPLNRGAGESCC